jgi:TPR repeat protein
MLRLCEAHQLQTRWLPWRTSTLYTNGRVISPTPEQHAEAEILFREAAALGHPHAWLALGNSLQAMQRPAEAAEAYRAATESGDPDAFLNLGLLHEDRGDWPAAESAYRQAEAAGDPEP